MKKFLSVILAAAMAFLSACDSTPQQRGVSGRAYISSSRPAIRVEAGELPVVTSGLGHGRIYNTGNASGLPLDTRAVVWGTDADHPMAVLIHAELPDSWDWTSVQSRTGSIHFETERLGGQEFAAYTARSSSWSLRAGATALCSTVRSCAPRSRTSVSLRAIRRYLTAWSCWRRPRCSRAPRHPTPAAHKRRVIRRPPCSLSKSLVEFRRRSGERKSNHFLRRHVRRRKYFSACKRARRPPPADSACAAVRPQIPLSKK